MSHMSLRRATAIRVVLSACLVIFVAGMGVFITYRIADTQEKNYYEQRRIQVGTAAAAIDVADLQALQGSRADLASPAYDRLRAQLVRIKNSDSRIRFVYLMRPDGKKLIFLVDAEDPSSPDYSPPGQVYEETKPKDMTQFTQKNAATLIEGPTQDRWGTWISATAFIPDKTGTRIAMLGTDVDVKSALADFNSIRRFGLIFDVLVSLLLALVLLQLIFWRYNSDRREALRSEMEGSILKLNEELLRSDRMKSEFVQLASHELRGPVNAVNIAVGMMDDMLADKLTADEQKVVTVAKNGTDRLVGLVNNLLDLTRLEAGDLVLKPEQQDVRELVTRSTDLFQPMAQEKGLRLQVELPEGDLTAVVDEQALLRVLENLVSNAIKFTDAGQVQVLVEKGVDSLRFSVKDTGRGIGDDFSKDVFNKFARETTSITEERGAGMGLSLCKGLVEAMGGHIWFESRRGSGTTFFFDVPRHAEEAGAQPSGQDTRPDA